MLLSYQWITETLLVAMRLGETPVYIPNTQVKPEAADGTMLETVWESRWLPDYKENKRKALDTLVLPVIQD